MADLKASDIDWQYSEFGAWTNTRTGKRQQCQLCKKHNATWAHNLKKGKAVVICFGCHERQGRKHG